MNACTGGKYCLCFYLIEENVQDQGVQDGEAETGTDQKDPEVAIEEDLTAEKDAGLAQKSVGGQGVQEGGGLGAEIEGSPAQEVGIGEGLYLKVTQCYQSHLQCTCQGRR